MILKDIHNECKRCANLRVWNIHKNGEYDYRCITPPGFIGFVSKDLHREPCEKFEENLMSEYINKSDALDILDQFEDAVENGEYGFYSKARKMMCDLPTVVDVYIEDKKPYICISHGNICREDNV